MIELVTLHKHWCIADAVRVVIAAPIQKPDKRALMEARFGNEFCRLAESASLMARLSVWDSLLYVVIEGYKAQALRHEPLDQLLAQGEYLNLLRLFRNGTFHFQENPISEKLIGFLDKEESEIWVKAVNYQLESFFRKELPIRETLASLSEWKT